MLAGSASYTDRFVYAREAFGYGNCLGRTFSRASGAFDIVARADAEIAAVDRPADLDICFGQIAGNRNRAGRAYACADAFAARQAEAAAEVELRLPKRA